MEERFGKPPLSVRNLTDVAYLKHKSAQAGIKMISERSDRYVIRLEDGVNLDMAGLIKLIDRSGARFSGQDSTQIFLPMQRRGLNGLIDFVMDMIKLKNM
jgi:transcription-repair coupling factor (superfamily II helicase)